METIRQATKDDAKSLAEISVASFIPAHGHSASKEDIQNYMNINFSIQNLENELEQEDNHFYLLYKNHTLAGYYKIVLHQYEKNTNTKNTAYMSRLYLLPEFYGLGLGEKLFNHSVSVCKKYKQKAIWLVVWIENKRAISFYKKMSFKKVGDSNFKISETHYNPNHVLYLPLN